jgi:hypothetical protein
VQKDIRIQERQGGGEWGTEAPRGESQNDAVKCLNTQVHPDVQLKLHTPYRAANAQKNKTKPNQTEDETKRTPSPAT